MNQKHPPAMGYRPFWRRRHFWVGNAHCILVLSTYLLLLLARLIDTAYLTRDSEYLGVMLLQVLIFLVPGLVYCKLRGNTFTDRLRLRMPRPAHIPFLLSALVALITGCLLISILTGGISTVGNSFTLYDTFSAGSGRGVGEIFYLLLAYAVLPAVCEEFIFRGVICVTLEPRGLVTTVAYSALSFAMLHFELRHFPVYLFAGILLCVVLYCTRSLAASAIVHLLYNVFGLFGQPALTRFYLYTGSTKLFTFLLTVLFLLSLVALCGQASRIYRNYSRAGTPAPYRVDLPRNELPLRLLGTIFPPIGIVCAVVYLLACIFI